MPDTNQGWRSMDNNDQGQNRRFVVNGVAFTMVFVEGGSFRMGCTESQLITNKSVNPPHILLEPDEVPWHDVTLSSCHIGQTPVTQELWMAVMGENPSRYNGDKRPVECVSWHDCQEFIRRLNELTGERFRLPTEAEWEFAARGGNKSKDYRYSGSNILNDVGWYWKNSGDITLECLNDQFSCSEDDVHFDERYNIENMHCQTHEVSAKSPNELGIYDMSGNVFEWCNDWFDGDYYMQSPKNNPQGPEIGQFRVMRGGSCFASVEDCRNAHRLCASPDSRICNVGFRLAL